MAKHTGQTFKKIEQDSDRDNYMSAQEAMEYGLIDKVVVKLEKLENKE
jgi:ATP-dependent Clp protease, protease subunit